MIEAINLSKSYGNNKALDNFSVKIPKGTIYGLLGPNGAGKTTFLRILNQIIPMTSGQLLWNGNPLDRKLLNSIGYMPEERGLYRNMVVEDQLIYLSRLRNMKTDKAKRSIQEWFDRLEIKNWRKKKVRDLSKGMAQKIQFITTVLHSPKLLILDEPFTGLDPINSLAIQKEIFRLNTEGATVLFSSHRMESIEQICSHICLLNNSKKVLEGNKLDLKEQYRTKEYLLIIKSTKNLSNYFATLPFINVLNSDFEEERLSIKFKFKDDNTQFTTIFQNLPEHTEFLSLEEILPSIEHIFVSAVKS